MIGARWIGAGLMLAAAVQPVSAQAPFAAPVEVRLSTLGRTCAAIVAAVTQEGAVILDRGPGLFDRIVRDQGFCPLPETTKPAYASAADTPQCFVGYRCADRFNEHRQSH